MARTPDSSAFAKGLYMSAVKSGESAQRILNTKEVTGAERPELMQTIRMAEKAKEYLRDAGVKI